MINTTLTNTNISSTFYGLLHAKCQALPSTGQEDIYDGAGNRSAIKIGRSCNGVTICGTLSTGGSATFNGPVVGESFASFSSLKLKENIAPITGALNTVMCLSGVTFNWKSTGVHDIGLIAEEVYKVVPEVVICDANNHPRAVDYSRLVVLLIEAVKELVQNKQ